MSVGKKRIHVDGMFRGGALAFCSISVVSLFRGPDVSMGLFALVAAAVALFLSFSTGVPNEVKT